MTMAACRSGALLTCSFFALVWMGLILDQALSINITSNDTPAARLYKDLTPIDRIPTRPTKDRRIPTNVSLAYNMGYINGLVEPIHFVSTLNPFDQDIAKQELSTGGALMVHWNDPFLIWDPAEYDSIQLTHIPASSIWTPPMILSNSFNFGNDETNWRDGYVDVSYQGNVGWYPKGVFKTLCVARTFTFPFDTQICNISIWQWQSTNADYKLTGTVLYETVNFIYNLEWKLMKEEVFNIMVPVSGGVNVSEVRFVYTLKRQPTFHVMTIIVPMGMLFIVGLMAFPLPADSGEKVSLCVTCLMSFFIMQVSISEHTPKSWESLPIIMIFNTMFMSLNVLSVCVTVFVLSLHHRNSVTDPPVWLQRLSHSRWLCSMKGANAVHDINIKASHINLKTEDDATDQVHANSNTAKDEMAKMRWKDAAEAVNCILGCVYIFSAIVMGSVCVGLWAYG